MIVLEHPDQGVDVYSKLLEKILRSAGVSLDEVWITYLFHCPPPKGVTPSKKDRDACKVWLWRELELVRPPVVLALGAGPTSLLQRAKPKMCEVVGQAMVLDYFPWGEPTLVSYHSLPKLFRGKIDDVKDLVAILKGRKP